jgi:hypothetical protein
VYPSFFPFLLPSVYVLPSFLPSMCVLPRFLLHVSFLPHLSFLHSLCILPSCLPSFPLIRILSYLLTLSHCFFPFSFRPFFHPHQCNLYAISFLDSFVPLTSSTSFDPSNPSNPVPSPRARTGDNS